MTEGLPEVDTGRRRVQIVEAALEVLAERGHAATSLRVIAERVGLSQPGLLYHFSSKDDLLLEALRHWERSNVEWLQSRLTHEESFPDRLMRLVELHLQQSQLVRSYMLLAAGSLSTHNPTQAHFRVRYRDLRNAVAQRIAADIGERMPAHLDPVGAANLCMAVMDGVQIQWLLDPDEVDFAVVVEQFLRLIDPGWHPPPDESES